MNTNMKYKYVFMKFGISWCNRVFRIPKDVYYKDKYIIQGSPYWTDDTTENSNILTLECGWVHCSKCHSLSYNFNSLEQAKKCFRKFEPQKFLIIGK